MIDITENIVGVLERIAACSTDTLVAGRSVRLLAVSKKQPVAAIQAAHAAGIIDFGENYLQEAIEKIEQFPEKSVNWHYIGAIQSNKTQQIAARFDWVHSVDRLKIARRLSAERVACGGDQAPLNICLQVNIDRESTKAGVVPEALPALVESVVGLDGFSLRGLMAIPDVAGDKVARQESFAAMASLWRSTREQLGALGREELVARFDTLSMGMSADLEEAIAAGANLVRVGTALFGPRD